MTRITGRLRLKRDGTCAETRFCLMLKWMSPNRRGHQFSRPLAAEVCASALVMLDTPCSKVVWEYWLPTPFTSFPLISPPVRHRVPSGFKRTLIYVKTSVYLWQYLKESLVWEMFQMKDVQKIKTHFTYNNFFPPPPPPKKIMPCIR